MNTLFTGQTLIQLDKVDSTNRFASGLIAVSPVKEGTVITAMEQTNGKGQRGNSWISEPGKNITLSIILKPAFLSLVNSFQINKALALALRDFFVYFKLKNIKVKWPNDIYINNSKAAGILIENQLRNDKITYSIAGIGININQCDFPGHIGSVTSLKSATGKEHGLDYCMDVLCGAVEKRYLQLRGGNYRSLDSEYQQHLYKYNVTANYLVGGRSVKGTITGVSQEGKLKVEHPEGVPKEYNLQEIAFQPDIS